MAAPLAEGAGAGGDRFGKNGFGGAEAVREAFAFGEGGPEGVGEGDGLGAVGVEFAQSPVEEDDFGGAFAQDEVAEGAAFGFGPRVGAGGFVAMRVPAGFGVAVEVDAAGVVAGGLGVAVGVGDGEDEEGGGDGGGVLLEKGFEEGDGGAFVAVEAADEEGGGAGRCAWGRSGWGVPVKDDRALLNRVPDRFGAKHG